MRRAAAYRAPPSSSASATSVDVDYDQLIADPVAAVTAVYAAADLDPPPDPTGFVAYHAAHPRHAHGSHRYTAASFGLDEHELRDRFSFLEPFIEDLRS